MGIAELQKISDDNFATIDLTPFDEPLKITIVRSKE